MTRATLAVAFCAISALGSFATESENAMDARVPFPHHTVYWRGTIRPSHKTQAELDSEVVEFYRVWKKRYLRTATPGELYVAANAEHTFESSKTRAVSEGHGYGMLITVSVSYTHLTLPTIYSV